MPFAATLSAPVEIQGATRLIAPNGKVGARPFALPANVRLVQTSTTGSIDILKILTALAHGADGVMVAWVGRATESQRRRAVVLRELLHFVGCNRERLALIEGAPEEGIEARFVERVRRMGPWVFAGNADLRAEVAALPMHSVAAHAPLAASQALRKVAVELLQAGKVDGVLAWGQGKDEIRPTLARTPEEARHLFAGGRGYPNRTTLLGAVADQNVAVVVRPSELACIEAPP